MGLDPLPKAADPAFEVAPLDDAARGLVVHPLQPQTLEPFPGFGLGLPGPLDDDLLTAQARTGGEARGLVRVVSLPVQRRRDLRVVALVRRDVLVMVVLMGERRAGDVPDVLAVPVQLRLHRVPAGDALLDLTEPVVQGAEQGDLRLEGRAALDLFTHALEVLLEIAQPGFVEQRLEDDVEELLLAVEREDLLARSALGPVHLELDLEALEIEVTALQEAHPVLLLTVAEPDRLQFRALLDLATEPGLEGVQRGRVVVATAQRQRVGGDPLAVRLEAEEAPFRRPVAAVLAARPGQGLADHACRTGAVEPRLLARHGPFGRDHRDSGALDHIPDMPALARELAGEFV
jgi:hypothetical protein